MVRCTFGHDYVRFEYMEDSSLADGWGYLRCNRCGDDGYLKLFENEYRSPGEC